ncbi:MAG TPA: FtsX-like permease family protein [Acidimicrobiia bacterium]
MLLTTVRNLLAHKFRLFATGLAVILGVAFMSGTLVLTDTIQSSFNKLFASVYDGTSAVVRQTAAFKGPNGVGDQRGRVDASLVTLVKHVDGVAVAEGDVFGYAQIVDKHGDALGNPNNGPPVVGGGWSKVPRLNGWKLVAGTPPRGANQVVIDKHSADKTGYRVGDTARVLVKGGAQPVVIAGIAKFGGADSPGGASFVLFTIDSAQRLVGEPSKFDTISVVAQPGISQQEIARRIQQKLPAGTEAVTAAKVTKESQDAIRNAFKFFNTFMLVFAVIALLVGGFIIFNTFFITVAQRTRENALLRALGAKRRQVLLSVLLEALAVGVIASAIGVGAGVVVAAGLKALLSAFGFDVPAGGVVLTAGTIVFSLAVGIGITLLSAVSPARKAGKVPPVAALRDVAIGSTGYGSKQRIIVGCGILVLGGVCLADGLIETPSNALLVVGVGVLLVFFGVSVLGRTIALPLSQFIGWPLPRLRGICGHLARENAMRNPKRTAATASALMVGVGLVAFISIFAASAKASFNHTIDASFHGDFVVTSPAGTSSGGIDPSVTKRLSALPEVQAVGPIRAGVAEIDGSVKQLLGASEQTFALVDVKPQKGSPHDLGPATIAIYKDVAKDKHLAIGDRIPVVFKDTGRQQLRVAMIYGENQPAGNYLLGIQTYEKNFADQYDSQIFVKKARDVNAAAALSAVKRAASVSPGAKVLDQTEYKANQTKFIDQLLGLIYAMLALAIIIALLGIGNTLALSILERTRELGLMRAVGMTRRQLRSSVRWESVIIALQGALLGLVVGVFFGWALVTAMHDQGFNTLRLPAVTLVTIVVLAAVAGVLAAVLPARRAAKLDVLQAIVTE